VNNIAEAPAEPVFAPPYTTPSVSCLDSPPVTSAVCNASVGLYSVVFNVIPNPFTMQPVGWMCVCVYASNVPSPPPALHVHTCNPWYPRDLVMWINQMPRLREDADQCTSSVFHYLFGI